MVSDYARLDIIYNYGGIYLDTDVEIIQNIDDLLYQKGFAGFQNVCEVNVGLGFGGIKRTACFKKLRDLCDDLKFSNEGEGLDSLACPIWQTKYLRQHGLCLNGECQIIDDLTIYPEKVLCGKELCDYAVKSGTLYKDGSSFCRLMGRERKFGKDKWSNRDIPEDQ